jgi:Zn-finger nucleic acid-binding protein
MAVLCPRCSVDLNPGKYHQIDVGLCPECSGVLMDRGDLIQLLSRMSKDIEQEVGPDYPIEPLPDKGGTIRCPRCSAAMENYGYMGARYAIIDFCPKCDILWLDTKELGVMCLQYMKIEQRQKLRRIESEKHRRELQQICDVALLSGAARRSLLYGFVLGGLLPAFLRKL